MIDDYSEYSCPTCGGPISVYFRGEITMSIQVGSPRERVYANPDNIEIQDDEVSICCKQCDRLEEVRHGKELIPVIKFSLKNYSFDVQSLVVKLTAEP